MVGLTIFVVLYYNTKCLKKTFSFILSNKYTVDYLCLGQGDMAKKNVMTFFISVNINNYHNKCHIFFYYFFIFFENCIKLTVNCGFNSCCQNMTNTCQPDVSHI